MSNSAEYTISQYTHQVYYYREYPFCIDYIRPIVQSSRYYELREIVWDMDLWLGISVGGRNYTWSDSRIISDILIHDPQATYHGAYPRFLFFKYEQDLLAFKLR